MKSSTLTIGNRRWPAAAASIVDTLRFLAAWARDPKNVAAVAPSGRALAELITLGIDADTGPVLELGPGTGVFTQALIDRGVAESALTLVELDGSFARLLRGRYPAATVLRMDGADLAAMTPVEPVRYGAVICGLGLLNMDAPTVEAIVRGAFAHLRPGGAFFLFTYGPTCSVSDALLARLDVTATRVGTTFRNIPPASVYRIARRVPDGY